MNISDRCIRMKIQSAFQSIINLLRLFVILDYQQYHPISSVYRKTTVQTIFHHVSFPDGPISQNTMRKRYIQNEQELSTYVGIS